MRAQFVDAYGTSGLTMREVPRPVPLPGQVLVAVHASGVNPADFKIAAGHLDPVAPDLPAILGMDFAGTVVELSDGVTDFAVGDAVYGCAGGVKGRLGTLAEFVAVDVRLVAPKPERLSMREAAALPLVAITAWDGLILLCHKFRLWLGGIWRIQCGHGGCRSAAIAATNMQRTVAIEFGTWR
jgi:NADPH2:quinone reductase